MTKQQADGVSGLVEQISRVVEKSSHKGGPEYVARSVIEAMRALDPALADMREALEATANALEQIRTSWAMGDTLDELADEAIDQARAALSRSERKEYPPFSRPGETEAIAEAAKHFGLDAQPQAHPVNDEGK